jgi:hypothetical protein
MVRVYYNSQANNSNNFRSLTSQNGARTKSTMGKRAETVAASSGCSENNGRGSCQAHHVGFSPQEDRGGCAGEVGEDTGAAEEGGVEIRACREYAAGFCV